MADRCSFCGSTAGPFNKVGGLFTLLAAGGQVARMYQEPGLPWLVRHLHPS